MTTAPKIERRGEQYYVAIHKKVNMRDIPAVLPPLIPEVIAWVKENGIPEDGLVFFHYKAIDAHDVLDTEVGILVPAAVTGSGNFAGGCFPEGNYASLIYKGDYKNMKEGHIALESWISENGFKEKQQKSEDGVKWGGRTELYLTDPDTQPDPSKWETEILFLLED